MEVLEQLRSRAAQAIDQARHTMAVRQYTVNARYFFSLLDRITSLSNKNRPARWIVGQSHIASTFAKAAIEKRSPTLVLYWEPAHTRKEISPAERKTVEGLRDFLRSRKVEPVLKVVLADSLGAAKQIINYTYLRNIQALFKQILGSRVSFLRLSDLYAEKNLTAFPDPLLESEFLNLDPLAAYWLRLNGANKEQALRYAAVKRNEQPLLKEILGDNGILLSFAHPLERILSAETKSQIFLRSACAAGFAESPPWTR